MAEEIKPTADPQGMSDLALLVLAEVFGFDSFRGVQEKVGTTCCVVVSLASCSSTGRSRKRAHAAGLCSRWFP